MKKFPYLTFFSTWALVFCGTLGAPLCVVTAYDLPYHLGALVLTALIISSDKKHQYPVISAYRSHISAPETKLYRT